MYKRSLTRGGSQGGSNVSYQCKVIIKFAHKYLQNIFQGFDVKDAQLCSRSFKSTVLANRASKYMYLPEIQVILVVFPYLLALEGYLKRRFFQFYIFPILAN